MLVNANLLRYYVLSSTSAKTPRSIRLKLKIAVIMTYRRAVFIPLTLWLRLTPSFEFSPNASSLLATGNENRIKYNIISISEQPPIIFIHYNKYFTVLVYLSIHTYIHHSPCRRKIKKWSASLSLEEKQDGSETSWARWSKRKVRNVTWDRQADEMRREEKNWEWINHQTK